MIEVPENERRATDRNRPEGAAGKKLACIDDIDGAQGQTLVDVGLLAKRGRRKDLHRVTVISALLDFTAGPHRGGVIRLANLVNMRKFEFGLRLKRCHGKQSQGQYRQSSTG